MSQEYVSVTKGYHADAPGGIVEDVVFPLVRDYKVGKKGDTSVDFFFMILVNNLIFQNIINKYVIDK